MPWLIVMSVAFETDQRKVADWPRSTVEGSAEKLAIDGRAGGGGGALVSAGGGGGGGGGGAFFLHPAANNRSNSANRMALKLRLFILVSTLLISTTIAVIYCRLHTGFSLLPCEVSGRTSDPFANIV
jgi:hypothetical protein